MFNCFPMKAEFKSDHQQSVRWQRMWGNHPGAATGDQGHMLWGLCTLLEKGKAITCKHWEPPEEWKLPWADQREPPSLTNRFSSKTLTPCAPKAAAWREGGEWYGAGRETWKHQHTKEGGVAGQPSAPTQSGTGCAGGRMVWNVRMGDTRGFLQLFYRQEDAERKDAVVRLTQRLRLNTALWVFPFVIHTSHKAELAPNWDGLEKHWLFPVTG